MGTTRTLGAICMAVAAVWSGQAQSVVPETGMYWRSNEPGRGYFIEHQNGIVTLVAYAYEDGRPTFYVGAGQLQQGFGEVLGNGFPIYSAVGYEPWHAVSMELYRAEGGVCLKCLHDFSAPVVEKKVGSADLFFDRQGVASMILGLDGLGSRQLSVKRLIFGFPPIVPLDPSAPLIHDLRGEWVFVDTEDPAAPALRFKFTEKDQNPAVITPFTPAPIEVVFRDVVRDAEFVCRVEPPAGLNAGAPHSACELNVADNPVLWVRLDDVAVKQLQGGVGRAPVQGQAYRGPGRIIGLRVE